MYNTGVIDPVYHAGSTGLGYHTGSTVIVYHVGSSERSHTSTVYHTSTSVQVLAELMPCHSCQSVSIPSPILPSLP